tara:strand:+ start:78 stop:458 length:381 start_codon:yes stop_codon:yes gene_type:complete
MSSDAAGSSAEISGLLGYVGGFTNAPMLDVGFIESQDGNIYPKSYAMSCTFTVLHEHDLGWDRSGNFRGGEGYPYQTTRIPSPAQAFAQRVVAGDIDVEDWPDQVPAGTARAILEARIANSNWPRR